MFKSNILPHETNEDIKTNLTTQKMIMTMMMIAMMTMRMWVMIMMTMAKEEESFFARSVYHNFLLRSDNLVIFRFPTYHYYLKLLYTFVYHVKCMNIGHYV